ncbi:MAG: putative GST-like protein YibF [Stenotrophomonas maltophilia]|nr:MAG: putative GST-like protein YibF [Stenotrophomonas maltophilia]
MLTRPILFHNTASPFVRKVMVLLHETGQLERVDLQNAVLTPVSPDMAVAACNPSGKIPALVLPDGSCLHDSRVILEYLDQQHDGLPRIPRDGPQRWQRLTLAALADAVLDAAVAYRYEQAVRPDAKRWDAWLAGLHDKQVRSLGYFETHADQLRAGEFDIAAIGLACALGYLDFRRPDWAWRSEYPQLAAWFAEVSQRPSLRASVPA